MKKRLIALSVTAALGSIASSAYAQATATVREFNPAGVGHALIFPYFNTQGGNATLLNIVNTDTVNGKAIKVRFRGASNSDDILDFQVFLSPGDVWTAAITKNATTGLSQLSTTDKTCTVPQIPTDGTPVSFVTARLNGKLTGDALASETREGYVEVFNMGDIWPTTGTGPSDNPLYDTTKHVAGVPECATAILNTLTINDPQLTVPSTGLFGNWTIINVPQTTTWTGEAAALEARLAAGGAPGFGNKVYWPQLQTALSPAQISANTADPLIRGSKIVGAYYDLPDLSTPYIVGAVSPQLEANSLSSALAVQTVATEFLTNAGIQASTDWVVSMPTRRYYIAVDYSGTTAALFDNHGNNADANAVYFRKKVSPSFTNGNVALTGYQGCLQVDSVAFLSQEEQTVAPTGPVFSPNTTAPAPSLCGEVSTLSINGVAVPTGSVTNSANTTPASNALKSMVARGNIALPSTHQIAGWGTWTSANPVANTAAPNPANIGIPALTTEFVRAFNGAASAGVSGTYAATWGGRTLQKGVPYATTMSVAN